MLLLYITKKARVAEKYLLIPAKAEKMDNDRDSQGSQSEQKAGIQELH
jgi:hypothetical protein